MSNRVEPIRLADLLQDMVRDRRALEAMPAAPRRDECLKIYEQIENELATVIALIEETNATRWNS